MGDAELKPARRYGGRTRLRRIGCPVLLAVAAMLGALGPGMAGAQESRRPASLDARDLTALRAALEADPRNADILVRLGERYVQLGYFSEGLHVADRLAKLGTAEADVAARLIAARALVGLRRADEALARLEGLRLDGGAGAQAALIEGDAWLLKGEHGKAFAAYSRARDLADDPREADLALARLALATGDLAACRERIAPYLEAATPDPRALVLDAEIAKREGRLDDALAAIDRAIALAPEDVTARILRAGLLLAMGRVAEAGEDVAVVRDRLPDAPIADFLEALYLVRQGRIADARRLADRAARALPRYLPLVRLRAWLAFFEGRLEEAIALASQVEAADPHDIVASELKAAALLRLDNPAAALGILERLDRTGRIDDRGRILLAGAYMRLGRFEKALPLYERAMNRFRNLPELQTQYALARFALGEVDEARRRLMELARSGEDAFRAAVMLTLIERRLGRTDAAMAAAEQVDALAPRAAIGPNLKGLVALTAGDLAAARGYFEEALARNPGFLPARRNLAGLLLRMGDDDGARTAFEQILKADPKDVIALVGLAQIAERAGRIDEAERRLSAAIALAPKDAALRLAVIRLKERAGDLEGAFKAAVAADLLLPDRRELVEAVARLALATGRPGIAEQAWRRLVAAEPDAPRHRIGLARALLARGDAAGARGVLLQADRLFADPRDPGRRALLETLAVVEERAGDAVSALGYARELVRLFPETPGAHALLARLEAAAGAREAAIAAARAALAATPEDRDVRLLLARLLLESGDEAERREAFGLYEALIAETVDAPQLARIARDLLPAAPELAARAADKALASAGGSGALRLLAAEANWAWARGGGAKAAAERARALIDALDPALLDGDERARLAALKKALADGQVP